jgi:hypothetical protein
MSTIVKRNAHFLLTLLKYKKQAQGFLKLASQEQIKAICEIVANVIYSNVPIEDKYKRRLWIVRKVLKVISTKGKTEEMCKRIITKHYDKIVLTIEAVRPFIESL